MMIMPITIKNYHQTHGYYFLLSLSLFDSNFLSIFLILLNLIYTQINHCKRNKIKKREELSRKN